jgi:lysine 2,3-aminomutase
MSALWDSERLRAVTDRYAAAVTPELAELIDPNDPHDPIARQFVPSLAELRTLAEERVDPIGDEARSPVPGIVHRHRDRVLFKIVSVCPVYCRFCFRRESVGPKRAEGLSPSQINTAIAYIAAHPEIREVIFTGGDPFILSARRAGELTQRLAAIAHVKILRWHTRVPFVDSTRVSDAFVRAIRAEGAIAWVALHANHPREFTDASHRAVARLSSAGIPLVSQSVLLKGVNDNVATLEELMRSFVEAGVKPYYLHHPDLAPGTSHFCVTIDEGLTLMCELRARVSGLAMPTYVIDIPGGYAKVPLESANVEKIGDNRWRIRDHVGKWHQYPPAL